MERIRYEDVCFYPIVILPTKNFVFEKKLITGHSEDYFIRTNTEGNWVPSAFWDNHDKYHTKVHDGGLPSSYVVGHGITVDGIFVESSKPDIISYGILDYSGKNKPDLSVDRIKVIRYPDNNDVILETIEYLFRQKYQELVEKHVNQYHLDNATKECVERLSFHSYASYQEEASSSIRHLRI